MKRCAFDRRNFSPASSMKNLLPFELFSIARPGRADSSTTTNPAPKLSGIARYRPSSDKRSAKDQSKAVTAAKSAEFQIGDGDRRRQDGREKQQVRKQRPTSDYDLIASERARKTKPGYLRKPSGLALTALSRFGLPVRYGDLPSDSGKRETANYGDRSPPASHGDAARALALHAHVHCPRSSIVPAPKPRRRKAAETRRKWLPFVSWQTHF